jgi:O-antigen ligase
MQGTAFKRAFQLLLFIAFSAAVGLALVLNPGASVGGWVTNLAPAIILGMILMIWMMGGLPFHLSDWMIAVRKPNSRELMVTGGVVLVMVPWAVFIVLQWPGVTYVLTFLLATVGVLGACVLIASGRQVWGLALWIVTMPFVQFLEYHLFRYTFWEVYAQGPFFVTPTTLILWLIGMVSLLRQLASKRDFMFFSPIAKVWLLMVTAMAVSAIFSADRPTSFRSVTYLLTIAFPYFMAVYWIRTTREIKLCSLALGLAEAVRVLSVLYHQALQTPEGISGRFSYYGGYTIIGALVWGTAFGFLLLFGGAFCVRSKPLRVLLFGLSITVLVSAVPVLSRSQIISSVAWIVGFLTLRRTRPWVLGGAALAVVVFLLWGPILSQKTALGRFEQFSSVESFLDSQRMRLDGIKSALGMIRDHPVLGIGPGMWEEYIPKYSGGPFPVGIDGGRVVMVYISGSHNIYLDAAATFGIGGLLSWIALTLVTLQQSLRLLKEQRRGPQAELAMAFVVFTASYWIAGVLGGMGFEPSFFVEAHYTVWLFFGLLTAWRNLRVEGVKRSTGPFILQVSNLHQKR